MTAGVLDRTGRGFVRVSGSDRLRFLQGMLSNDVAELKPGEGCRALLLTVKGKMVADLFAFVREDDVLLETDEGRGAVVAAALDHHLVMEDATIADETAALGVLVVLGPRALDILGVPPLSPYRHVTRPDALVAAVAYTALPTLHVIAARDRLGAIVAELNAAGCLTIPADEVETMRIEAGYPRWGRELHEDTIPLEAGLADAISFTKGCYTGQEVIARVSARGHVNWRLVGLTIEDGPPPAPGTVLSGSGRDEAARVTSSCASAAMGGSIALGYAFRTHAAPGTPLRLPDGRAATVVALPFAATPTSP
jgi:folate-binding protein YgfZ